MIAVLIIAAVMLLLLGFLYYSYYRTFYSPHKNVSETHVPSSFQHSDEGQKLVDKLVSVPCEFVSIRSFDGLSLSARYYKGRDDMPLCICFHGYRGSAVRDFSGGAGFLLREGCSVLLPDHRAHWRSEGHTITYGIKERRDALSWIEYANDRFGADKPVFLFGISMGAATVLMASGLELPANVRGISADCPYNDPEAIIKHICRKIRLSPTLMWPAIRLSGMIFGRFDIASVKAAEEVKKAKVPILLIHGEADDFVPTYMSEEIAEANPGLTERHTFPGADHGTSYLCDPGRYERIIKDFLTKNL